MCIGKWVFGGDTRGRKGSVYDNGRVDWAAVVAAELLWYIDERRTASGDVCECIGFCGGRSI